MRKFLALALVLAVLTAGAWPLDVRADEESAAPPATATAPADAAKDSDKDAGKKAEDEKDKKQRDVSGGRFAGDPVYVHLAPMILPVITDNGAEQIVTLQIAIEVKDFDAADTVHTNMPRVMDALMRALYGGLGNGDLRNGQLIDVSRIKSKAIAALGEAVGADNIRDVLIEAVAQRKL